MNLNNYLTSLSVTTLNLSTNLAYGYGDLATTEINSLKALIAKSEEMIPILETEACMAEVEELDREDRSFNNWMTMLYGNGDDFSPMESRNSAKANRLKRRKANKKHHKADRYHGKKLMVVEYKKNHEIKKGLSWLYRDCHCPVGDDVKYSLNSIKAKEKDYSLAFTGIGELLEDIAYLEDRIYIYEEDIKNLEYDKAFGYLTEEGEEFLEYYKKELEELKEYKQYKEVLLRTATR
jgi:hypothetical protein